MTDVADWNDWDITQNRIAAAAEMVKELQEQMGANPVKSHSAWSMLIAAEVHLQNAQDAVANARQRLALDELSAMGEETQDDATNAASVAGLMFYKNIDDQ